MQKYAETRAEYTGGGKRRSNSHAANISSCTPQVWPQDPCGTEWPVIFQILVRHSRCRMLPCVCVQISCHWSSSMFSGKLGDRYDHNEIKQSAQVPSKRSKFVQHTSSAQAMCEPPHSLTQLLPDTGNLLSTIATLSFYISYPTTVSRVTHTSTPQSTHNLYRGTNTSPKIVRTLYLPRVKNTSLFFDLLNGYPRLVRKSTAVCKLIALGWP